MKFGRLFGLLASAGVIAVGSAGWLLAADHLDPSPRVGGAVGDAADIADIYAWNTDTVANNGNLVLAMTFAGPLPGAGFTGDPDVLYGIHVDHGDNDLDPDVDIWVRFAQDSDGNWGVQFTGIPGTDGPVEGKVGGIIELGGASAFAGVREDPFFFDLQGFRDTLMTGTLSFNPARDFFAGANVSAIVVELPLRALPGSGPYQIWGTTGRI